MDYTKIHLDLVKEDIDPFLPTPISIDYVLDVFDKNSVEETEKRLNQLGKIYALDVESNGKELLVGIYSDEGYKYFIMRKPKDIYTILDYFEKDARVYFYGDYDLPVMLAPFMVIGETNRKIKKMMMDQLYVIPYGDKIIPVVKYKNYYKAIFPDKVINFINLMPFYSSSLYEAYEKNKKYLPNLLTPEEEQRWKEDKAKRENFENINLESDEIKWYNMIDTKVTYHLALILKDLYQTTVLTTVPSTAIVSILKKVDLSIPPVKFPSHPGEKVRLQQAVSLLYRGGLFDTDYFGIVEKAYKYDVNSMYPYFMSLLPRLEFVKRINGFEANDNPILKGTQYNPDAKYVYVYLLFQFGQKRKRVATKDTYLMRLHQNFGVAIFDFELSSNKREIESDYYLDCLYTFKFKITEHRMFKSVIEELYQKRLELKKQKDPREKTLKLILNSSYGKFGERDLTETKFKSLLHSAMITAMGRTFIVNLDPHAHSYLTDSIITSKPLKSEWVGDELGKLKLEGEGKAYIAGNGQYVLEGSEEKLIKFRGFNLPNEVAEKIIKTAAEYLTQGKIIRIPINTKLMVKNPYTMRDTHSDNLGLLANQQKIFTPMSPKQHYVFEGDGFYGYMLDRGQWKEEKEKLLKGEVIEIE